MLLSKPLLCLQRMLKFNYKKARLNFMSEWQSPAVPDGKEDWLRILASAADERTRDALAPKSVAPTSLRGVQLVQGTPDAPEALFAAAPGPVYTVDSVQLGLDNPGGLDSEMAQARALADAAAAHGVRHFIYAGANFGGMPGNRTNVPHFDTKRVGEEYLQSAHPALPTTVLRPVTIVDQLVQGDPASTVKRTAAQARFKIPTITRLPTAQV
ncbi:hypothetical protein DFH08DRAFT_943154 [Mycena albidolilacea]|uniref:NmrA-like domain-containing protein n=1 Tax=Mycena albidolilacea TaxID=1033008 RepID=A0AAD7EE74_9AGAR|nr:hypothetical protein DFH08DRAFT_943154 [Mycena albidolilacea]